MRLLHGFLMLVFTMISLTLAAQSGQRATVHYRLADASEVTTFVGEQPFLGQLPFFAYFLEWDAPDTKADIRFSADRAVWTPWESFDQDGHNLEKGISELHFGRPEYRYYELRVHPSSHAGVALTLHFYQPGESAASPIQPDMPSATAACPCPMPNALSRSEWCPNGCPPNDNPSNTNVTHLIVHHSASPNTANDWAAVVRSFWDFHVNGNGWSDIGYNWLVDPNGVIYTGRGDNVLGAHFCAQNTGTAGICVIGDFTNALPTTNAVSSLSQLLAWKTCDINVDPLGSAFHNSSSRTLMRISGHRDGCNTACPGESFYPALADVRTDVANRIATNCSGLATPINLAATPAEDLIYELTWIYTSPDATGFQLEWSQDGGATFLQRASLPAGTLTFTEDLLTPDRIYLYRIRAFNESDTSPYSNVITINTGMVNTHEWRLPAAALRLSPNPTSERLTLHFDVPETGNIYLQLMDATQRVVLHQSHIKRTSHWHGELDVSQLPTGIYWLQLILDNRVGTWRVVVE